MSPIEKQAQIEKLTKVLLDPTFPAYYRDAVIARIDFMKKAREKQLPPAGDWLYWLIRAGRGFGKTYSGAGWLANEAMFNPNTYWAVVAPTFKDLQDVCFEGKSGLLKRIPESMLGGSGYLSSKMTIELVNGSKIFGYSAETPERLRGPNLDGAWTDEVAAWKYGGAEAWKQLQYCLREGKKPRVLVTTTPKPTKLFKQIQNDPRTIVTNGTSMENTTLSEDWRESLASREMTDEVRQEVYGELLDDSAGAFLQRNWWRPWTRRATPKPERVLLSYDTANKTGKRSDTSACTVWGLFRQDFTIEKPNPVIPGLMEERIVKKWVVCLLDAWKLKISYPDMREKIQEDYDTWCRRAVDQKGKHMPKGAAYNDGTVVVLIENCASGQALLQEMSRAGVPAQPYSPGNVPKETRVAQVAGILKSQRVFALGKWDDELKMRLADTYEQACEMVVEECGNFFGEEEKPGVDDLVDTVAQALSYLRDSGYLSKDSDRDFLERDSDEELEEERAVEDDGDRKGNIYA